MNEVISDIFGQAAKVDVQVLPGNSEIFEKVLNGTDTVSTFSVGTAGISITKAREEVLDFLPSFFSSGLQVMAHSNSDFSETMNKIINNFFIALAILIGALFFFVSVLAPMAWLSETQFPDKGTVPVFIDWNIRKKLENTADREVDLHCFKLSSKRLKMMVADFFVTLQWTVYTIFGTLTGYPNGLVTRVIHGLLKGVAVLMIMVGTATFAAVFTVSSESTSINNYAGLRDHVVCTVSGSTSETYLTQNNVGFGIHRSDSVSEMFDAFWLRTCDAVVYDFPALQDAIVKQEEETGTADAALVGPVFNKEFYGIATKPGNPYFETLRRAVIALNNDNVRITALEKKWFSKIEGVSGDTDVKIPTWVIVVPSVLGVGVLIFAIVWLYWNYNDHDVEYDILRRDATDMDYRNDRVETLKLEQDTMTRLLYGLDKTEDLIVSPYVIRIRRMLEELTLMLNGEDPSQVGKEHIARRVTTMSRKEMDNDVEMVRPHLSV
jgi:ABC-type amino acid transport substrate-binding protein